MDAKTFRKRALETVSASWGVSIGAAAVAVLLAGVGTSFLPQVSTSLAEFLGWAEDSTANFSAITVLAGLSSLLGLVQFIIGGVIEVGYCDFLLKQHNGWNLGIDCLFSRFDRFGTNFAQRFLRNLYTGLWMLLLIVPGIMAAYSYAMTPYILAEFSNLTASEAIRRSKEMMKGHRWELFVLHLSFIGWQILAALTLNIGNLWLNPYCNAAEAAFYQELEQNYRNQVRN